MRNIILCLTAATLIAGSLLILKLYSKKHSGEIAIVTPAYQVNSDGKENEADGIRERVAFEKLMTMDPALGYVPSERLIAARQKAEEMKRLARAQDLDALTWVERGPNNLAGRTRAILIDITDLTGNTVFAGSVSGGLWKTVDFKSATPTWNQVASVATNLSITTLAQDPSAPATMYAGTGEWADDIRGGGIYKSTNGGTTWSLLTSTTANIANFTFIQKILVYTNGDVYVAAFGDPQFCNAGGVIRSKNGGTSWTRVIGTYDNSGSCAGAVDFGAYDIEMATNGDLYASVEDHSGVKDNFDHTADTTIGKVYRSSAGANVGDFGWWVNVTPPPPPAAKSFWQRIELAPSPTDPNTIYAVMQGTGDGVAGIRVTNDKGGSWNNITNTSLWCDQGSATSIDFSRQQAWYDLAIGVKPDDDRTVLVGGVDVMKTTSGGGSWFQNTQWRSGCTSLPVIHADIHGIYFFPGGSSSEFIVVNDGGIYYSNDNGSTYVNKNRGYRTIQYYSAAIHPASGSNYMLAGAQDNGSHKFTTGGLANVSTVTEGDGGFCFIDQTNPNLQVTSFTNANYMISRNGGTSFNIAANFSTTGRFINPTDLDNTTRVLYAASSAGNLLRINDISVSPITSNIISFSSAGTRQVSAVKVDPVTPNRVWVAFSGDLAPQLYYMDGADGSVGAPVITQVPMPSKIAAFHYIGSIDVDPTNANHILMTVRNYGVASIYESTNLGQTWVTLDKNGVNLPDMPVWWAMFLPDAVGFGGRDAALGGIMIGTELGAWTTATPNDSVTVWTQSSSMPNVRVTMLKLRIGDNAVVASTYGRGLFTTTIQSVLPMKLLTFDGKLDNGTSLLNWTTSEEHNSKDFEIEKSTDGINYSKIGTVTAAGNSATEKKYAFRDLKLSPANYYRLKMNDRDGKNKLTQVVLIRYNESKQNVVVVNNPFKNYINLRFTKPATQARVQMFTASGMLVAQKTFNNAWGDVHWDVPSQLSQGGYVVRVVADGELFTTKTIKQ